MPISDIEIRADKDRVRAEFAIKVHKLESEIEEMRLAEARQKIDINRRDSTINSLERNLEKLQSSHEEATNARHVLEQTISDRLPRVEHLLNEAKKLLFVRDREIGELTANAQKQAQALSSAKEEKTKQSAEIERLNKIVRAHNRRSGSVSADEANAALVAEVESLREKTREQAQLLARLQQNQQNSGSQVAADGTGPHAEMKSAADGGKSLKEDDLERQIQNLKAHSEDQIAEIARLKASLAVFEAEVEADSDGREGRISLKAKVQALEIQASQQTDTIAKLRSELAGANERAARQASHFTNELRRLGNGSPAGLAQGRRIADRVAQSRGDGDPEATNVEKLPLPQVEAGISQDSPEDGKKGNDAVAENGNRALDSEKRPRLLDRISNLARQS